MWFYFYTLFFCFSLHILYSVLSFLFLIYSILSVIIHLCFILAHVGVLSFSQNSVPAHIFFLIHECPFYRTPWNVEMNVKKMGDKNKILGVGGYFDNLPGIFKYSSTSLKHVLWTLCVHNTARYCLRTFKMSKFQLSVHGSGFSKSHMYHRCWFFVVSLIR